MLWKYPGKDIWKQIIPLLNASLYTSFKYHFVNNFLSRKSLTVLHFYRFISNDTHKIIKSLSKHFQGFPNICNDTRWYFKPYLILPRILIEEMLGLLDPFSKHAELFRRYPKVEYVKRSEPGASTASYSARRGVCDCERNVSKRRIGIVLLVIS